MLRATRVLLVVPLALIVACSSQPAPTPSPSPTSDEPAGHFDMNGLSFDYPAGWAAHTNFPLSTGFGQLLALVGNMPWGPCDDFDINCHYEQTLEPGHIEIAVGRELMATADGICGFARDRPDLVGRGPDDPPVAVTRYFRIDGHPAIYTQFTVDGKDHYLSDEWRDWLVAEADPQTAFSIEARFRDPGDPDFRATLDELIASLHVGIPFGVGVPRDECGAPFPAASTY